MSDAFLVKYCTSTSTGLRTGSLFHISYADIEAFRGEFRELSGILKKEGFHAVPACMTAGFALVYLYQPDFLKKGFNSKEVTCLLKSLGYESQSVNHSVVFLARMMRGKEAFPHEVGLFLDYPPGDVLSFMKSSHEGVKCIGCWKVYDDEARAWVAFWRFQRCREVFKENVQCGRKLKASIVRCTVKRQENYRTSGSEKIAQALCAPQTAGRNPQKKGTIEVGKVTMVFWSGTGNTQAIAETIVEGVRTRDVEVTVLGPNEFGVGQVAFYDAITFGCSSMGAKILEEEEFEPMLVSVEGALHGKKIALFGSWGWGGGAWMNDWEARCNDIGILMRHVLVICQEALDDVAFVECREFDVSLV